MRKLLFLLILGTGLWSGYWFAGSSAIKSGADGQWFADQAQRGMVAEKIGARPSVGFPQPLRSDGRRAHLCRSRSPASAWQAPFAQVFAMTWKPWHIIAALPPEQVVTLPDQSLTVTSEALKASLRAKPSADLPLAEIRIAGNALALASSQGLDPRPW